MTFRNTWSWGTDDRRPSITAIDRVLTAAAVRAIDCRHAFLGRYIVCAEGAPQLLLCQNESNLKAVFGTDANPTTTTKDAINAAVIGGDRSAVLRPGLRAEDAVATKAAFWYRFDAVAPGDTVTVRIRLSSAEPGPETFGPGFAAVLRDRREEADEFYDAVLPDTTDDLDRATARRAFAGLLWGKQVYRYDVSRWLAGDPDEPTPPESRKAQGARNVEWSTLSLADVISMPDEWEYPWFASWDLAFHCVAFAHIDPAFAKDQLLLLCREWAMHPDGQLPAYEWAFGDVNPPVHAWAAWQVYLADGRRDTDFLMRIVTKMLLNFSWWINRKDPDGSNLFQGGFLGLDNIGLFNRSAPVPPGFELQQSDATSWMASFCLHMLGICLEIAPRVRAFDDLATKFLEHFLAIARAMNSFGSHNTSVWDEEDGFFYDILVHPDGAVQPLRVRSLVGLLPLLAVAPLPASSAELPDFTSRLVWLRKRHPEIMEGLINRTADDDRSVAGAELLSVMSGAALQRVLHRLFDEAEFFSPYGIRSLSAVYRDGYSTDVGGSAAYIDYEPGESQTGLFGGNSNWRGPIWFPPNVLLADALRIHGAFAEDFTVEVPTGSGRRMTLAEAADEIDRRLIGLFRPGTDGRRPSDGHRIESSPDPLWSEHPTFSEYFDGDTGEGLGATHQTGWTALVAHLICKMGADPTTAAARE